MDKRASMGWSAIVDRLFERIENEPGMRRSADPPPHDGAGIDVDHERDIDKARPGRDVGKVQHPQHVRRRRNCRLT